MALILCDTECLKTHQFININHLLFATDHWQMFVEELPNIHDPNAKVKIVFFSLWESMRKNKHLTPSLTNQIQDSYLTCCFFFGIKVTVNINCLT